MNAGDGLRRIFRDRVEQEKIAMAIDTSDENNTNDTEPIQTASRPSVSRRSMLALLGLAGLGAIPLSSSAHPSTGLNGGPDESLESILRDEGVRDPSRRLIEHDASTSTVVSDGPFAHVTKNLDVAGRGERLLPNGTTDVWALDGYAYIGTFNEPCGTGEGFGEDRLVDDLFGPGIPVFDVRNRNRPRYVGNIPSLEGSRINDIKVESMNAGDILVHSNEACELGGPGGFEIYDVDDPTDPTHLASVRVNDANEVLRSLGIVDVGVHNLFLFTQANRDYVAMQTHAFFGSFQIFEITDPSEPKFVSAWGAEYLCEGDFCSDDPHAETDPNVIFDVIFEWMLDGYGQSRNRFLHDVTVSKDGTRAYLAHWDAGLILMDISDPADPQLISVALEPTAGDGEVNSHHAWPSEDGSVVVETEEDFDAWESFLPPTFLTFGEDDPGAPLPGTAIATVSGDDFEEYQTDNAGTVDADGLTVDSGPLAGSTYETVELEGDQPRFVDVGPVNGDIVWIGRACDGDQILNADAIADGGIAVVRRGECPFREKNFNAAAAGADAIVIANDVRDNTPWGHVRIWDYSDEANPVLASTFDTVCSASAEPIPACDLRGTYSVHNTIVEREKAYFSWYSDGVLILDISDPYNPVETARYNPTGPEFEEENGGIQDVWGVYKEQGRPWIYASDRNGGLYVLKEYGSGSEGRGR